MARDGVVGRGRGDVWCGVVWCLVCYNGGMWCGSAVCMVRQQLRVDEERKAMTKRGRQAGRDRQT